MGSDNQTKSSVTLADVRIGERTMPVEFDNFEAALKVNSLRLARPLAENVIRRGIDVRLGVTGGR